MNKKVLKLGFIGGAINSAVGATHFIASQMDGHFKVEAGCFSRNKEINLQTATQWHIDTNRCYESIDQFLEAEKGRLDAVVVLTPTPNHLEPIVKAIQSGFPVISEKALAASSDEARTLLKAKRDHRGFLAVTYNYSGYPMLRELKNFIATGELGRVEQIHIEMPQEGFARLNREGEPIVPQQWRLRDELVPTISLDLGVHVHHVIDFLTGAKPLEVVAIQSSLGRFREVVDNTMCIARYENSLECSIWFSKAALGYRNGLKVRVFGEKGSAEWVQMEPEVVVLNDCYGHKSVVDRADIKVSIANLPRYNRFKAGHPSGFLEAFANLYADIANELEAFQRDGVQDMASPCSPMHAIDGLVMLEAISASSVNRCWKEINLSEK